MVVPLKSGGGTRIKILEGMAMGIPVLSTTIGAEGLEFVPGEHLWIADSAEQFATKTLELLNGVAVRTELADRARKFVDEEHSWARATQCFLEHCSAVLPDTA